MTSLTSILALASLGQAPQSVAHTAAEVAERYHAYYAGVLQDINMTKTRKVEVVRDGVKKTYSVPAAFGVSRFGPIGPHGIYAAEEEAHKKRYSEATKSMGSWEVVAFLVGNRTKPLTTAAHRTLRITPTPVKTPDSVTPASTALAVQLLKGKEKTLESSKEGFTLWASSVTFPTKECLKCHPKSKVGDAAAIMVYAIKRTEASGSKP